MREREERNEDLTLKSAPLQPGVPGFPFPSCTSSAWTLWLLSGSPHSETTTTTATTTEPEVETPDHSGMEGSSKPETVPPGLGRTSAMSRTPLSNPWEKMHSQTDSFLTAARLLRGGWTEEGKGTGWQFSNSDSLVRQPSDGNQGPKHAEVRLKDPRCRRVPVVISRRRAEDGETGSEKKADVGEQTTEGAVVANRPAGRQTGQGGIVRISMSGCRNSCRQSRRFKAPILPVIAEM